MEKFLLSLILLHSINPIFPTHFENSQRFLHVYEDGNQLNKPLVIQNTESDLAEVISHRSKRSSDRSENLKNITTKVNTQTNHFLLSVVDGAMTHKIHASHQLINLPRGTSPINKQKQKFLPKSKKKK